MNVAYGVTLPATTDHNREALLQEIGSLRQTLDFAPLLHLYPGKHPGSRIPRQLWGLRHVLRLRQLESRIDLHHIFNPDPLPLLLLRFLRKPVVYTAVTGLNQTPSAQISAVARRVHSLVLPSQEDVAKAARLGHVNTAVILPGIDAARFTYQPAPPERPLTLLMASAPWTDAQFESKGVNALLAAAQQRPELRLVFLWRGFLTAQMKARVAAAGLTERVQVIDEHIDVNTVLAQVHATVLLASDPKLVKAYPHSLIDSLLAGKPVLVSQTLPMAAYVQQHSCGEVVTAVTPQAFLNALDQLMQHYHQRQQQTQAAARRDFSLETFRQAYLELYGRIVG